MDHYKQPRNFGELADADAVFEIDNPLCGDKLKLQIKYHPLTPFPRNTQDRLWVQAGASIPTPPPLREERGQGESVSVLSPCQGGEQEGVIEDVKFTGAGCAISMAAASLLTEYLKNKTRAELLAINEEVVYKLLGIEINSGRAACAVLGLNGLKEILKIKKV